MVALFANFSHVGLNFRKLVRVPRARVRCFSMFHEEAEGPTLAAFVFDDKR